MKKGLIVTAILAAMLTGVLLFAAHLMEEKAERQALYLQQTQILQQQEAELEKKEAKLQELVTRYENGQTDGAAELEQLRQELAALQSDRDDMKAQLEQATADVEALRQQLENDKESDQSYYLEVYNALKEGLEKVKGYIAGN